MTIPSRDADVPGAGADGTRADDDAGVRRRTTGSRANVELFFVGLGALAVSLAQSVLIPVLGMLPSELHATASTISWLLTSTLLVAAVSVPIMGRLGDMFGKRSMLLVALGALVVGSLIAAVTDNIGLLILGRAIQGTSMAAIPLGISLLDALLPRERAASGIAVISAMLGVGGALGLPLAGLIAQNADFHALFWINGAVGAVALAGTLLVVPESHSRSGGRVDILGAVLLSAGLVCLLLPLTESSKWGWSDPKVLALLVTAAFVLVVFCWTQLRTAEPLVDFTALRRKTIVLTNLASLLFGFALFASFIGTAPYVEAPQSSGYGFGASLLVGGLVMLPGGLGMLLFAPVAARLIARCGAPRTLALGAIVVAVGYLLRIGLTGALWQLIVATTVGGIGTGIGYAAMPSLINANTPPTEIAAANGLNTLFRTLGSSLASSLGTSILAAGVIVRTDFVGPSLTAYRLLFLVGALSALLAAGAVLLIRSRPTVPLPVT